MSIDAAPKPFRGPWEGENKIVIGIDIGTTQSGVAFTFLQQGGNQTLHRVTKWPGQEAQNQQSKIPTIIWYDIHNKAVSFGAEALTYQAEEAAEDNGWRLAEHFKLHLHPNDMQAKHKLELRQLPNGVSLRQIYTDFLGYLLKHTRAYFEDRILDGKQLWSTYSPTMEVVIAHPNGWGIREQTFLRQAAVDAGLASAEKARSKVRFVTEAEASVHFCIYHTNMGNRFQAGTKFAVCDAGGSTVDTTLYSVVSAHPHLKLEEHRASACVQAGAIFVDGEAERYLRQVFTNAELSNEEVNDFTKVGIKDFETFAKRSFCDESSEYPITISHSRFNNTAIRTRRGRMTLPGSAVKSFFNVCYEEIAASVDKQIEGLTIPYMLLVGGFGDSPFLRQEFRKRYEPKGCQVTLANDSASKAVADGAVIWSTASSVVARAPRFAFGIACSTLFNPGIPHHKERDSYIGEDGYEQVSGLWEQIAPKGIALDAQAVSRRPFCRMYNNPTPELSDFQVGLLSYVGDGQPTWAEDNDDNLEEGFQTVCTITANLQHLSGALHRKHGAQGKIYWDIDFDVCIRFGGTELEGYIEWKENGATRQGPVTIIPDDLSEAGP